MHLIESFKKFLNTDKITDSRLEKYKKVEIKG